MALFGKKKPEPKPAPSSNNIDEIMRAVAPKFPVIPPQPIPAPKEKVRMPDRGDEEEEPEHTEVRERVREIKEPDRPQFAPLFVKIDRYRNILSAVGHLRASFAMVRHAFATLNELEKAKHETMKTVQKGMESIEKRLSNLDSELVRPAGFTEPMDSKEYADVQTVEATIADLRGQIEQLKEEMEHNE